MGKKPAALDLAEQLRKAIAASGLSMNRLAQSSGVTQGQLSRFMRAERTLTLTAAGKLCAFLGLRLAGPDETIPTTNK
jgi:transcriptional regulator with XRE-family HTH domain